MDVQDQLRTSSNFNWSNKDNMGKLGELYAIGLDQDERVPRWPAACSSQSLNFPFRQLPVWQVMSNSRPQFREVISCAVEMVFGLHDGQHMVRLP